MTNKKDTEVPEGYKQETKEVEKLVKPSPKKKPPRTDRQKRRMKIDDGDLSTKDPDMSMNYKDIGGSSRRVLMRVLTAFSFIPPDELKKHEEDEDEDEDEDLEEQALRMYNFPEEELVKLLEDSEMKDYAEKALQMKMLPLPPGWKPSEVFEYAQIKLKARRKFRRHMQSWDGESFPENLFYFKERLLNESLTSGRDDKEDYFKALISLIEEEYEEFKDSSAAPLTSLEDALSPLENPEEPFKDEEALRKAIRLWKIRLKRTSDEHLEILLGEVEAALDKGPPKNTTLFQWVTALNVEVRRTFTQHFKQSKTARYRGTFEQDIYKTPPGAVAHRGSLSLKDDLCILKKSLWWIMSGYVEKDWVLMGMPRAFEIALDLSIYSSNQGYYRGGVNASDYKRLHGILVRALTKS